MTNPSIHPTSSVSPDARVDDSAVIWGNCTIREHAEIGESTSIGIGVYVGPGVKIGRQCKVQNQALLYEPAELADGVFVGPGVTFTNDKFPRAITSEGKFKTSEDWHAVGVRVEKGASIGARAVCVAPLSIGEWAMVAAGSVVTKDVKAFELVGGVPARHLGWVGVAGMKLEEHGGFLICPQTSARYRLKNDALTQVLDS